MMARHITIISRVLELATVLSKFKKTSKMVSLNLHTGIPARSFHVATHSTLKRSCDCMLVPGRFRYIYNAPTCFALTTHAIRIQMQCVPSFWPRTLCLVCWMSWNKHADNLYAFTKAKYSEVDTSLCTAFDIILVLTTILVQHACVIVLAFVIKPC